MKQHDVSFRLSSSGARAVALGLALFLSGACGGGGGGGSGPGPVGGGTDRDGDGLSDSFESTGWEIIVDVAGFGLAADASLLTRRMVTSDPDRADTDGDGLSDLQEFQLHTDPSSVDTDGDLLSDRDETTRWKTNPSSSDTDGDSRGPQGNLVPDARLFDGNEVLAFGTSPTIADTDGDNRTDFVEANDPAFDPRISDLPRAELRIEGEIDVRLNVEYAEMVGTEVQYGTTQSTSSTVSTASSEATTHGTESSFSYGFDESATLLPPSKFELGASANQQWTSTTFDETTTTTSDETALTAGAEYSRLSVDSRSMTETVSSGSIRMGMRIRNKGRSAFTLTDLGVTVLQWLPEAGLGGGTFKTMGTLTPAISNLTLGPGSASGVIEVSSTSVDPRVIKDFLAHPSSLVLQPANFDMQNQEGIDFDFLTENTFTRTALIEVDYGDGTVESWRVATNVDRNPDGTLAGARLGDVLTNVLGLPQGNPATGFVVAPATQDGLPAGNVLVALRGRQTDTPPLGQAPAAFWTVAGTRAGMAAPGASFEDIRLRAGDELRLLYTLDADRDGVYSGEEAFYGSSDTDPDSDDDGVEDRIEAKFGRDAGVGSGLPGYPRRVFSDPRLADSDGDGLSDGEEFALGSDPTETDTDGDALSDGVDPFPLVPALRLYVMPGAGGSGASWLSAHGTLQDALEDARVRNEGDADPLNDVSEIWVAAGIHRPTVNGDRGASFVLPRSVALYGGFAGGEAKRGARNADPLTNGTVLSGDLLGNDNGTVASLADNSRHVVVVAGADRGIVLDGFEIRGGNADGPADADMLGGGLKVSGASDMVLRNLNLNGNRSTWLGGGAYLNGLAAGIRIEDCWVIGNRAETAPSPRDGRGGGLYLSGTGALVGCRIQGNLAEGRGGGAYLSGSSSRWKLERCSIDFNNRARRGAALDVVQASAELVACDVSGNQTVDTPFGTALQGGGLYWENIGNPAGAVRLVDCRLWNNAATYGGGMFLFTDAGTLTIVNCSVAENGARTNTTSDRAGGVYDLGGNASTTIGVANSIFWGNWRTKNGARLTDELAQIDRAGALNPSVSSTCIQGLATLAGSGNLGSDPRFTNAGQGNLRLNADSPCLDAGFNLVDLDPIAPGLQLLPAEDLEGNRRIVDGDAVPGAIVDLGAYERQP